MPTGDRPIVYISYRWVDVLDQGLPPRLERAPDPRARELGDRLRADGNDVRLDVYFRDSLHGFRPPERVEGDPQAPWLTWSTHQIAEADAVLLFCTLEYASTDPDRGAPAGEWGLWCGLDEAARIGTPVPGLWWDWHAIARECTTRPQKFIPIGVGPYHGDQIPAFVRGSSYINLSDAGGFEALLRRIRQVWRERHPRDGVFISYAHKDDQLWLDTLLSNLSWLQRKHGIEIWTDRDIAPGAQWHETIQSAIDRAKVAVLLVSPEFLASPYIINNELAKMLQAAESDGMTIFWIPVRPSAYRHSPIGAFQAAQPPDRPLSSLRGARRDQAFVDIGEKLAKALGLAADVSSASDVIGVKRRAQAEAAIKTILDDCYRRALFTRMHAQLDVDAMFASIDQCRISVQKNIPGIRRKDLQDTAMELLATVEQIERRKPIRGPDDVSAINKLKLAALHLFRVLAKAADSSYPLPETGKLGEAAYFTQQEADAPLCLDDLRSQTAINPATGETIFR